jgi:hypothetical protein
MSTEKPSEKRKPLFEATIFGFMGKEKNQTGVKSGTLQCTIHKSLSGFNEEGRVDNFRIISTSAFEAKSGL